jgi:predicted transcriptional regulator
MTRDPSTLRRGGGRSDRAEAVPAACRAPVAISAQSIAAVEDVADLMQVRAFVIVASQESVSLKELAEGANIHVTRASRLCDRMIANGLINRADDPADRHQLTITLTPEGPACGPDGNAASPRGDPPDLGALCLRDTTPSLSRRCKRSRRWSRLVRGQPVGDGLDHVSAEAGAGSNLRERE